MNLNQFEIENFLNTVGFWKRIECEDIGFNSAHFSAYDNHGEEVSLRVVKEDDELVVYEYYEGGTWTVVDLP